jgi:ABC-type sugar transport system permease subunit
VIKATALVLVMAFMALISLAGVPARAKAVIARSQQALADMRNKELTELEKEHALQAHARSLFVAFFWITLLSAIALLIPLGIVLLLAHFEVVDFEAVLDATMSWPVLLIATVVGIAIWLIGKRARPSAPASP